MDAWTISVRLVDFRIWYIMSYIWLEHLSRTLILGGIWEAVNSVLCGHNQINNRKKSVFDIAEFSQSCDYGMLDFQNKSFFLSLSYQIRKFLDLLFSPLNITSAGWGKFKRTRRDEGYQTCALIFMNNEWS